LPDDATFPDIVYPPLLQCSALFSPSPTFVDEEFKKIKIKIKK